MKKVLVVLMVVLSVSFVFGQAADKEHVCKGMNGYLMALKSDNPGLRLNAIYQIAQVKSTTPDADFKECLKELEKMAKKDKNNLVKVQANLTAVYLKDDTLSNRVKMVYKEAPADFFKRVYDEMNSVQMALN